MGAAETLVREGVSGHLLAPGDPRAWARAMHRRTAGPRSARRARGRVGGPGAWADVGGFVDGVGWLSERLA
ncbi:MAG: hypothetical protein U5L06_03495 [Rhodovibrio sp.]|nr:hypothetical protein [Rhodovibrio sp.]